MKPAPPFDPDKTRSDYPLGGEKTGPAWRFAWEILYRDPTRYLDAVDIVSEVAAVLKVNARTVRNLLMAAERAGILEKEIRLSGHRNRAHYRIVAGHR